jgi:hypothetical protein
VKVNIKDGEILRRNYAKGGCTANSCLENGHEDTEKRGGVEERERVFFKITCWCPCCSIVSRDW